MTDVRDFNDFDFNAHTPAEIDEFIAAKRSEAVEREMRESGFEEYANEYESDAKSVNEWLKKTANSKKGLLAARTKLRISRANFANAIAALTNAKVPVERLAEVTRKDKSNPPTQKDKAALLRIRDRHQSKAGAPSEATPEIGA